MATKRVMVLFGGFYYHETHRGIAEYAQQHGWHLNPSISPSPPTMGGWNGAGIIANTVAASDDMLEFLDKQTIPIARIQILPPDATEVAISMDDIEIGGMAAQHFKSRGFRHFVFCGDLKRLGVQLREQGYREELGDVESYHILPVFDHDPQTFFSKLKALPCPVAIYAAADSVGTQVIDACLSQGYLVPEEIAVLGTDNNELMCDYAPVTLSSVSPNLKQMGTEAASLLDRMMAGETIPQVPIFVKPDGVITRHSTDVTAVAHPEVAKALRFLKEHHTEPIGVESLLDGVTISRRGLFKAFEKHLGRGPGNELLRLRLVTAQRLLADTDMKVKEVAAASGFSDTRVLCSNFRRHLQQTPREYRNSQRR